MEESKKNYSLVSYLTGEDYKKVRELQKELSEITGSRKCLEDWLPHITVGDGITVSNEAMYKLELELLDISHSQNIVTAKIFFHLRNLVLLMVSNTGCQWNHAIQKSVRSSLSHLASSQIYYLCCNLRHTDCLARSWHINLDVLCLLIG